jgi:uncharacterized protein YjdB
MKRSYSLVLVLCCILSLSGCRQAVLDEALSGILPGFGRVTVDLYVNNKKVGSDTARSITTTTNSTLKSFSVQLDGDPGLIQYTSENQGTVTFDNVTLGDHQVAVFGYTDEGHSSSCIAQQYTQQVTVSATDNAKTITANLERIWSGSYTGNLDIAIEWPSTKTITRIELRDRDGNVLASSDLDTTNTVTNGTLSSTTLQGKVPVGKSQDVTFVFSSGNEEVASLDEVMNVCAAETSTFEQTVTMEGGSTETKTTMELSMADFEIPKPISSALLSDATAVDQTLLVWTMPWNMEPLSGFASMTITLLDSSESILETETLTLSDMSALLVTGNSYATPFSSHLASNTAYHATLVANYAFNEGTTTTSKKYTTDIYTTGIQATSVSVSPTLTSEEMEYLAVDQEVSFTAAMLPENASDRGYVWSSSNPSILEVKDAENGIFTVKGNGTANVIVTANNMGVTKSYAVTIKELTLGVLKAEIADEGVNLGWSVIPLTSTYAVMRKTGDGTFTKIASVTANSNGSSIYQDAALTSGSTYTYRIDAIKDAAVLASSSTSAPLAIAEFNPTITINPSDDLPTPVRIAFDVASGFKLQKGEEKAITLQAVPANVTSYKWKLNRTTIASNVTSVTINEETEGLNTSMVAGPQYLMVIATTSDGLSYSTTLMFTYIDTEDVIISLDKTNPTSIKTSDGNVPFTATVATNEGSTHHSVNWTSSDTTIATIDGNGNVTALKDGSVTITASSVTKPTLTDSMTLKCIEPVTGISLTSNGKAEIFVSGENGYASSSMQATVLPSGATNKKVTYTTSDATIATVDPATGAITAAGAGKATITAHAQDGGCTTSFEVTSYDGDIYYVDFTDKKGNSTVHDDKVTDTDVECTGYAGFTGNTYSFEARYRSDTVVSAPASTFNGYSVKWSFEKANGSKTSYGAAGTYLRLTDENSYTVKLNRQADLEEQNVYVVLLDSSGTIVKTMKFKTRS